MSLFSRTPSRTDFDREAMPHTGALYGVALRLTRNEGDAEDLLQETMLRAYRFFDSFEPGTNCKAWLFRILHNTFCNRYREREREQQILDEAESSTANLGQFVAGQEDTETSLLGRMVSADVERALAAVPPEFRMAVILADLEDFSYKEIAEIMDCPAGTVMSRLYRGRRILQSLLYDYAVEQGILRPAAGKPATKPATKPAMKPATKPGAQRTREAGLEEPGPPISLESYRQRAAGGKTPGEGGGR
jgi:RNA polymerase sigma-70 factor, ECF subfamily